MRVRHGGNIQFSVGQKGKFVLGKIHDGSKLKAVIHLGTFFLS